jgi:hypothetical protein
MLLHIATALLALQVAAADTVPDSAPAPASAAALADAYLDAGARELVSRARERRLTVDRSVTGYQTLARERITLGVRVLNRERQAFIHESATRLAWRREGTGRVEVLGARYALPLVSGKVRVPGIKGLGTHLAYDPADADLVTASISDDGSSIRHPLAEGSEEHYRFRSGGETHLRLPDGRTIRLVELQVIPRRREFYLASGSLWLEADTHAVVRAVVQPARPWDIELDGDEDDTKDVPGFVKPIRAEIRYITIDYGLWEMRWWLPRLIAFEGVAEVGLLGGMGGTVRYERSYADYHVEGAPLAAREPADTEHEGVLTRCPKPAADEERSLHCSCNAGRCRLFEVVAPADTASLLESPYLPHSIHVEGPALFTEAEMRQITDLIESLRPPLWRLARPSVDWQVARMDLLRYNRVEGLSVGARAVADFGAITSDATLRLGVADLEPNAELGVERQTFARRFRVAGYRRLAVVDPTQRPLGLGNSLSALFLGRDEGDYFRTLGAELIGTPARSAVQWYQWRLFGELQRAATQETDFSVPRLFDEERVFRPNLAAERADQLGASLQLRLDRGMNPVGFRWGADLFVEGSTGTFDFVRPSLTLGATTPLPGRFLGAVEVAGGTAFGDLPVQSGWYLGGAGSVRGYAPLSAGGNAFWRARAEVSNALPGARLVLFSDAGWAGSRDDIQLDPALLSAGVGASFLDGLIRFDIARALRGERQWRAELYFNGNL